MYTRREFSRVALAGAAAPFLAAGWQGDSIGGGVRLGVQTYSFRDLPRQGDDQVDVVIGAMRACGLTECELYAPQVEPRFERPSARGASDPPETEQARLKARDDLRLWRLKTPLDFFMAVRRKFETAGITIYAYNLSFNDTFSDQEINRGFEIAHALGAGIITASATLSAARRVAPFADRHRMIVAMHNHSKVDDPNEFATPASFEAALKMSAFFKINLDIGHFTAANFDALSYLRDHHDQITNLHLKDRKKNQGDNVPWGEGDTPIREVLSLLKTRRSPIRAYIEYEYRGAGSPVEEVKKCFAYAKKALAS